MEKFNEKILWSYKPSRETLYKGMEVTKQLGMLSVRLSNIFNDAKTASKLFAFIESKYSSKIEGIYTTLFDVINTGRETNQTKIIKPLIDALLTDKQIIEKETITNIEIIMNTDKDRMKRWKKTFGVYKGANKIYEPLLEQAKVEEMLDRIFKDMYNSNDVIKHAYHHILFEKLHPFVDANGRLGRLLLTRQVVKLTNFAHILPISWSIFKNQSIYYESFDIQSNKDIDNGVKNILDIILHMCSKTTDFTVELGEYISHNINLIKRISNKISDEMAYELLLNLQLKNSELIKKYALNHRTIKNIFENLENLDFNEIRVGREKVFWNINLESIINKYFGG